MTHLDTHTAIIGASGSGKTVTAKGDVEHLLDEKRHLAVIDPLGVWWGLRSAADGEGKGFDIPIFGGDHGDVQILPEHGEAIGAYIAGGMSAIVDLSGMEQREGRIFMLAFIKALRKKPKANFHLIVDEADEFAPQTAPDEVGFQLTEQMVWIAKRGRTAGFVLTAITQRPADISKAVLSQMQTVIAHQLVAPQDQKALDAYLQANGEPATRKMVMASLAGLERGERWFYSPRAKVLERDVSPMPRTFDSSRTPEPGEAPIEPKLLAAVDMGAIRAALAPKELPQVLADVLPGDQLEKLIKANAECADVIANQLDQIADLEEQIVQLVDERNRLKVKADEFDARINAAIRALGIRPIDEIAAELDDKRWSDGLKRVSPAPAQAANTGGSHVEPQRGARTNVEPEPSVPEGKGRRKPDRDAGTVQPATGGSPSPAALAIADLLDRINPARVTWTQAATMTKRKASGGNFNAARKWLRESGRIVEDGDLIRSAKDAPAGMTRDEAIDLWRSVLSNPAPKMITAFLSLGNLTKEGLGEAIGAQPRGGNFNNGLSQLRRNGLLYEYGSGTMRLAEPLPGEAV